MLRLLADSGSIMPHVGHYLLESGSKSKGSYVLKNVRWGTVYELLNNGLIQHGDHDDYEISDRGRLLVEKGQGGGTP